MRYTRALIVPLNVEHRVCCEQNGLKDTYGVGNKVCLIWQDTRCLEDVYLPVIVAIRSRFGSQMQVCSGGKS